VHPPFRKFNALPRRFPELPKYFTKGSSKAAAQDQARKESAHRRSSAALDHGNDATGAGCDEDDGAVDACYAPAGSISAVGETIGQPPAPNLRDLEAWLRTAQLPRSWAAHFASDNIVLSELYNDIPVTKYAARACRFALKLQSITKYDVCINAGNPLL
jgi:hypothetical protein